MDGITDGLLKGGGASTDDEDSGQRHASEADAGPETVQARSGKETNRASEEACQKMEAHASEGETAVADLQVDLNAEEEKARADLKQKSLSAAEQELEQGKQEVSNLSHKFEMERQKSVGLSEAHWTLQPAEAEQPQVFDISTDDEFEELVLPEMPFAPPESEYSDDSDNETTEHLAQFPQAAKPQMFDMSTDSTAECKGQVANDDELSNAKAKTDFKPRTRWGKVDRRKAAGKVSAQNPLIGSWRWRGILAIALVGKPLFLPTGSLFGTFTFIVDSFH